MSLRSYVRLWLFLTLVLSVEYYLLVTNPQMSITAHLRGKVPWIPTNFNLSAEPGRPISFFFGVIGFGLMVLMNLYSVRKRIGAARKLGSMKAWLDFHIFCGLMGPTLIVFHTGFKVGGLVAVSFWSMMISFTSGIIGRYFYGQLLVQKVDLEAKIHAHEHALNQFGAQTGPNLPSEVMELLKSRALAMAGAPLVASAGAPILVSFFGSFFGDLRLRFGIKKLASQLPETLHPHLVQFAVGKRRLAYLSQFQRMMGYWHAFHFPFAVFMYAVALIHIAAALLFGVSGLSA